MTYIILATIAYTLVIMLGSFASKRADSVLVAGINNLVSAIIPFIILLKNFRDVRSGSSRSGIIAAILAGICIAIFVIFLIKSYSVNKVAIVAPVVFGGSMLLSAILSFFIYKEKISGLQAAGLTLVLLGILLIVVSKLKS